MRNHLETSSAAQYLDGGRLPGRLHVPGAQHYVGLFGSASLARGDVLRFRTHRCTAANRRDRANRVASARHSSGVYFRSSPIADLTILRDGMICEGCAMRQFSRRSDHEPFTSRPDRRWAAAVQHVRRTPGRAFINSAADGEAPRPVWMIPTSQGHLTRRRTDFPPVVKVELPSGYHAFELAAVVFHNLPTKMWPCNLVSISFRKSAMSDILRQRVLITTILFTSTISPAFACTHGEYQCQAGIRMQCTCDKHGCIWKDTGNNCSPDRKHTSMLFIRVDASHGGASR